MIFHHRTRLFLPISAIALVLIALPALAAEVSDQTPFPDGKEFANSRELK